MPNPPSDFYKPAHPNLPADHEGATPMRDGVAITPTCYRWDVDIEQRVAELERENRFNRELLEIISRLLATLVRAISRPRCQCDQAVRVGATDEQART